MRFFTDAIEDANLDADPVVSDTWVFWSWIGLCVVIVVVALLS